MKPVQDKTADIRDRRSRRDTRHTTRSNDHANWHHEKGIALVARVDHAAAAAKADMKLRPTQALIFSNPKLGTPLMQSNPRIGLDLPLKVLAWEDAAGKVWVGYTRPSDLAARHAIADRAAVVQKMGEILDQLTTRATQP